MEWSAELTWGIVHRHQSVGTQFYKKGESSVCSWLKYLHMCCEVSGQYWEDFRYIARMQTVFAVKITKVYVAHILEAADSLHVDCKIFPYLSTTLQQAHIRTNMLFHPGEKDRSEGHQNQDSFI